MNATTESNPNAVPPVPTEVNKSDEPSPETIAATSEGAVSNIVAGGLWCAGGILVTALTYNAAQETGGHYIIAWGAILFGGIQFLKGLFQLSE